MHPFFARISLPPALVKPYDHMELARRASGALKAKSMPETRRAEEGGFPPHDCLQPHAHACDSHQSGHSEPQRCSHPAKKQARPRSMTNISKPAAHGMAFAYIWPAALHPPQGHAIFISEYFAHETLYFSQAGRDWSRDIEAAAIHLRRRAPVEA